MSGLFNLFRDRDDKIGDAATADGLHYAAEDPFGCDRDPFPLLKRGTDREVNSVVWRESDTHAVRSFDYRFFMNVNNDTVPSQRFSCISAIANAAWPYLSLSPTLGTLGISKPFSEHERFDPLDLAFADAFYVHCSDDKFATMLLDAPMRSFLLENAQALDIEFNGAWLFAYSDDNIPPDVIPHLFPFIDDLLAHIPSVISEFYEPPLSGGIDTPMPDPGLLARKVRGGDADPFDFGDEDLTAKTISNVLGDNHRFPGFEGTFLGHDVADAQMDLDILHDRVWDSYYQASPLGSLAHPPPDGVEYDLDGNPIVPDRQDPWGPGRSLKHKSVRSD